MDTFNVTASHGLKSVSPNCSAFNSKLLECVSNANVSNDTQPSNITRTAGFIFVSKYDKPLFILICSVLSAVILITTLGNIFVILAVGFEKTLKTVQNYQIQSLALTDLFVAVFCMPFDLIDQVSENWFLGNEICDLWSTIDMTCCTASILHLVVISLDRYWSVTNVYYARGRSARKILFMISCAWFVAILTSIPQLFGHVFEWKGPNSDTTVSGICEKNPDVAFQIYAVTVTFYLPLAVMVIITFKTYLSVKSEIQKRTYVHKKQAANCVPTVSKTLTSTADERNTSSVDLSQEDRITISDEESPGAAIRVNEVQVSSPTKYICSSETTSCSWAEKHKKIYEFGLKEPQVDRIYSYLPCDQNSTTSKHQLEKETSMKLSDTSALNDALIRSRERKAARVLCIITGTFIACWLPFFLLKLLSVLCKSKCNLPKWVFLATAWLGYLNSTLNPVIYTVFNCSFRAAFRKMIHKFRNRS